MKNKGYWIGSVIIFVLAVVCFVVFGVGTEIINAVTGAGKASSFGKYDGKDIELIPGSDFANAVQNYSNYFQSQGQNLDENAYFYIYSYAFNAAVQSMAYKDSVKKSGYAPSEKSVSRAMLPYFSSNGKFDPAIYAQVSESDKSSIKKDIVNSLTYQRFAEDVFGSSSGDEKMFGAKASSKEAAFAEEIATTKRGFEIAYFDKNAYPDSEVLAYANENKDKFEKYSLSIVSFDDEAEAKKIRAQILNNEITFEDAISEYSKKYYSNSEGKITNSYAYQISSNIANADDFSKISSLKNDEVSDVIKMHNGYTIYKCTGDKVAANFEDEATLKDVKSYIKSNESGRIEDFFMNKANGFAKAAAGNFTEAANEFEAETASVAPFPLNYGELSFADKITAGDISALANAGSNENLLEKAFALKENEISEPIVNGNYIVVMKLTSTEKTEISDDEKKAVANALAEYDQISAQTAILTSDKVQNNVAQTYFKSIRNK